MKFTSACIATILAYASSTTASPIETRQTSYKDFQVSKVDVSTASRHPNSDGWSTIRVTVTDPNEIRLSSSIIVPAGNTVNCEVKYSFKDNVLPLGRSWDCDKTTQGFWTFEILPGSDGDFYPENFNLQFTHVVRVWDHDVGYYQRLEGEGNFARSKNLDGRCGSGGACLWSLKEDSIPVLVKINKASNT